VVCNRHRKVLIVEIDVATRCAERGRRDRHALLLCAARRGERALGASGLVAGFPCRPRAIRSAPAAARYRRRRSTPGLSLASTRRRTACLPPSPPPTASVRRRWTPSTVTRR